jgi:hypothetical protein
MTMNSGPMLDGVRLVADPLVTVEELLQPHEPPCGIPGPHFSRCMRAGHHVSVCAALGTDTEGVPIVVCWWPAGRFPTDGRSEPGE